MTAAFIVDGMLEKKVVQRLCANAPVRMTNLNGKSVSIEALVKAISSLITLLQGRSYPIVVVVDREDRSIKSIHMEDALRQGLVNQGHQEDVIIVAVSDRMIENWILGGLLLPEEFAEYAGSCDGCHGKSHVKEVCRARRIHYDETVVGVELFCHMDYALARSRSPSFARFASRMELYCRQISSAGRS